MLGEEDNADFEFAAASRFALLPAHNMGSLQCAECTTPAACRILAAWADACPVLHARRPSRCRVPHWAHRKQEEAGRVHGKTSCAAGR